LSLRDGEELVGSAARDHTEGVQRIAGRLQHLKAGMEADVA
jgi:hypothetical protein